jgi:hypothetical protein
MYTSMHSRTEIRVGGPDVPARAAAPAAPAPGGSGADGEPRGTGDSARNSSWPFALCGVLLVAMFLGMCLLGVLMAASCYELIREGSGLYELYLQSALFAGMGFVGLCALPVIAERNRVGRFIVRRLPV